jgi:ActR/RegA family two-component response regulator
MPVARPRLIYLVTEDWAFIAHRLPMARAARNAGYEVHVATRVDRHGATIEAEGFRYHPIDLHRGSINPFNVFAAVLAVRRLYKRTVSISFF